MLWFAVSLLSSCSTHSRPHSAWLVSIRSWRKKPTNWSGKSGKEQTCEYIDGVGTSTHLVITCSKYGQMAVTWSKESTVQMFNSCACYIHCSLHLLLTASFAQCVLRSLCPLLTASSAQCVLCSLWPLLTASSAQCVPRSLCPLLIASSAQCVLRSLCPLLTVSFAHCVLCTAVALTMLLYLFQEEAKVEHWADPWYTRQDQTFWAWTEGLQKPRSNVQETQLSPASGSWALNAVCSVCLPLGCGGPNIQDARRLLSRPCPQTSV